MVGWRHPPESSTGLFRDNQHAQVVGHFKQSLGTGNKDASGEQHVAQGPVGKEHEEGLGVGSEPNVVLHEVGLEGDGAKGGEQPNVVGPDGAVDVAEDDVRGDGKHDEERVG